MFITSTLIDSSTLFILYISKQSQPEWNELSEFMQTHFSVMFKHCVCGALPHYISFSTVIL